MSCQVPFFLYPQIYIYIIKKEKKKDLNPEIRLLYFRKGDLIFVITQIKPVERK